MSPILLTRRTALLAALATGSAWMSARAAASTDTGQRLLRRSLALLEDNERLRSELLASIEPGTEAAGVLRAYLDLVRRDGPTSHAALKQRLERVAVNNTTLAMLLLTHAPVARTPAFGPQAVRFRDYATAWRTRWAAATPLQCGDPAVPEGMSETLQAELSAL